MDARATVLVIDDLESLRETTAAILGRAGYQVLTAGSGAEALAILRAGAEPIDLVILDASMPGLTGRQTYAAMRELPQPPRVVFTSGYAAETLEGLEPNPPWAFLPKPFDTQALVGTVRALLGGAPGAQPVRR